MTEKNVRLCSVELFDYKNVAHGKIEMPCAVTKDFSCDRSEILGIYGQNGSGKTTVIEALSLTKCLLSGQALPLRAADDIAKNTDTASCLVTFFIGDDGNGVCAEYSFTLRHADSVETAVYLAEEKLSCRSVSNGKRAPSSLLLRYEADKTTGFLSPKYRYTAMAKGNEAAIELAVAKKIAIRNGTSFLFSEDVRPFIEKVGEDTLTDIIRTLSAYASECFFVVGSDHSGTIAVGSSIPLALQFDGNLETPGHTTLSLTEPSVQALPIYRFIRTSVDALNLVIGVLIPDMRLLIKEYGGQVTADGRDGMRFEILSVRGETKIPLKCESEGIKKLISVLNILIAMYHHPSVMVAVDEFDAGVYEYLLGEILGILENHGRGQLLFTSHNLRPLEMIDRRNLVFTTTNPENRYIRLSGVKGNLRDEYIRSIYVGGQKEELYDYCNPLEIARAFRLAGQLRGEKEET